MDTFATPDAYIAALKRRGFERLGKGYFSAAYAKPGSPFVVKVFHGESNLDPWPLYAEWCWNNPGPFKPVIRALKWHGEGSFYVAVMERLLITVDELADGSIRKRREPCAEAAALRKALVSKYNGGVARVMMELQKLKLNDVAAFVAEVNITFPDQYLDIHGANWMYREDGSLVLIDPFSDENHMVRAVRLKRAA